MAKKAARMLALPYGHNPSIFVYYELKYKEHLIVPGDKIKIKNQRGHFVFKKWVHNSQLDVSWIDVTDPKTQQFKAFYLADLKGPALQKKSIRKKIV